MSAQQEITSYSPMEEKLNIISHGIGLCLSVIAFFLLIQQAVLIGSGLHIFSFSIYGVSLIALYAASTSYHSAKNPIIRSRLRVFDHVSIYMIIAGSYTPFALITLNGQLGWLVFGLSWGSALMGAVLKLFFTGKYDLISTLLYILMGWMIVLFIDPLMDALSSNGLIWLVVGGVSYTVGAVIYSIEKIKYNHAIFHVFVLVGSTTHFISIYFYVLPSK